MIPFYIIANRHLRNTLYKINTIKLQVTLNTYIFI